MGKLNKICYVCNKSYKHCYSCPSDLNHPSWMEMFDTENCKNIFNILCKHSQKMITEEEARVQLKGCDLSQKEHFADHIVEHINRVLGNDNVSDEKEIVESEAEVLVEAIVEDVQVVKDEHVSDIVETTNTNVSYKKTNHKKRNRK